MALKPKWPSWLLVVTIRLTIAAITSTLPIEYIEYEVSIGKMEKQKDEMLKVTSRLNNSNPQSESNGVQECHEMVHRKGQFGSWNINSLSIKAGFLQEDLNIQDYTDLFTD